MKYYFNILLSVALLFACMGLHAEKFNDKFGTIFSFKVRHGKAIITSYSGNTERVRIPANVADKKGRRFSVVAVDLYNVYDYIYDTQILQIEEGVERIEDECFSQFENLYEVYVPQSVKFIGKDAFKNGRNISFVTLPVGAIALDLNEGKTFYPNAIQHKEDPISFVEEPQPSVSSIDDRVKIIGKAGESDVDVAIPFGGVQRDKTFCLIIGNEKYISKDTPNVPWAETDAKIFRQYCRNTLGIPEKNIVYLPNAGYLDMKKNLDWLKMVSNHYGVEAKYIFYYAGHGAPDIKGKCYLIPREGSINDTSTGIPLSDVYATMGNLGAQSAIVLVDACFSGTDRHDDAIPDPDGKRGIARAQEQNITGKVVAITAASNTQTALAYDEKAHGLFTYFLLKALRENRGNLTYGELYDYVKDNVGKESVVSLHKEQTPTESHGFMGNEWRDIRF